MCGARRRAGGVRALLLFLVTCILTAWCDAGNVHVIRHLADSRYSNLWDGVIWGAWLNFLEGVGKSWNAQDTSRFGTAYIRRREASENQQRLQIREKTPESIRRRNVCCLQACDCVINCDCDITILDHLEFIVCPSTAYLPRSTVGLCETPRTFITVIRTTALPWTIFRDLWNLRNLQTFGLHWPVRLKSRQVLYYWDIAVSANLWANWDNN